MLVSSAFYLPKPKLDIFQNSMQTLSKEYQVLTISPHYSLEKDPGRRASPWRMLEHPWMIEMRSKRVNMAHFLAKVWGWDETK
jgi:hypothetical protein